MAPTDFIWAPHPHHGFGSLFQASPGPSLFLHWVGGGPVSSPVSGLEPLVPHCSPVLALAAPHGTGLPLACHQRPLSPALHPPFSPVGLRPSARVQPAQGHP